MKKLFVALLFVVTWVGGGMAIALADTPTTNPAATAVAPPPVAEPVAAPGGTKTGTAADVVGVTPGSPTSEEMTTMGEKEPLAVKLADVIGHNRIAINMVWTLICGFLVMFMQARFALAETGFTRAKNAGHTMAMSFMVYALGLIGYWACGFAIQMGGVGGVATLGGGGRSSQR